MDVLITDDATRSLADIALAKRLAEVLLRRYPGHAWAVTVQSEQGIATVLNLRFSGRWGFLLKLRDLTNEKEIAREAMLAGGEFLERYRVSRGRFKENEYEVLPTKRTGDLIFDAA